MDIWVMNTRYAVLFFLRITSCCLGLHAKTMRCEVIAIQNYCYALMSCHILLTDHSVGIENQLLWGYLGLVFGGICCLFFSLLFGNTKKLTSCTPCQHCIKPTHWATELLRVLKQKGCSFYALSSCQFFIKVLMPFTPTTTTLLFNSF